MEIKEYDVIVVGGGPAGIISAKTARKYYADKKILLIKNVLKGVIPCGIPYMFATLEKCADNAMGDAPLKEAGIDILIDEVNSLNASEKRVQTKNGKDFSYQKLILATGSNPIMPPIEGLNKEGVYPIHKEMDYLSNLKEELHQVKNVLIIGGGFIGVELADEFSKLKDKKVSLVEFLPNLLMNSFDVEFGSLVEERLKAKGVNLLLEKKVTKILGDEKVSGVELSCGTKVEAEMVVLGIGAKPNTNLAQAGGLEIGKKSGILVDEYMRTSNPHIFAVGDCAEKKDFFTRKDLPVMLASTATAEARVAGANLYELQVIRENKGTIAIYSTWVDGLTLGSAGLTEETAKREGFVVEVGKVAVPGKHPATLPGTVPIQLKLIFAKHSGILMGGQVAGSDSAGEIINIIGMAIQKRVSVSELETLQMATHPHLTPPPTMYHLVLAAQNAC